MNNFKAIAIIGSLIVVGKYCYNEYKRRKAEFEKHKEDTLAGRDLSEEIDAMTIDADGLDDDLKVAFKKVLNEKRAYISSARTTKALDSALKAFDDLIASVNKKEGDSKTAAIKFYVNEYEEKEKAKAERKAHEDRIDEITTIGSEIASLLNGGTVNLGEAAKSGIKKPYIIKDPKSGQLKYWSEEWQSFRWV